MDMNKVKKSSLRRLSIIRGQVKGLERMVKEERYCIDTIRQSLAIKEALSSFENLILENHLSTHAVSQMKSKNPKKAVKEILEIYKLSKKK